MKKLFMKISGYDEISGSLLVQVASDETKSQNPEDYPILAYQPATMFPGVTNTEVIKKRIAIAAKFTAEQEAIKEQIQSNPEYVNAFKAMVNSTEEYNVETDLDFNSSQE
jgi:hypothetical protein